MKDKAKTVKQKEKGCSSAASGYSSGRKSGPTNKAGNKNPIDPSPTASKALKKKKKKKKQQQEEASGNAGRDFSADLEAYCTQWSQARESWRFNKVLQTWALEHCMDRARISKALFKSLLPYLATIQGGAKERLLAKVDKIIEDGFTPDEEEDEEGATLHSAEVLENVLKRAVKIKSALE